MIRYTAKKMFGGRVSVKSPVVDYAKRVDEKIRLTFKDRFMIVTPHTQYTCDDRFHKAEKSDEYIKKGEYYKLYDYVFNPRKNAKFDTGHYKSKRALKNEHEALGIALGKLPKKKLLWTSSETSLVGF